MGKLTIIRVKANSILETTVAMVIILTVFGIATFVFVRVSATAANTGRLQAHQVLMEYAARTEKDQEFFDDRQMIDSFEVRRYVQGQPTGALWKIHYYIYDRNHLLLSDWQQYSLPEK
ncbi:MAG TPA: hypothetical protein VGM31_15020 [Puia sp.]|jgi:hypothetical protein